MVLGIEGTKWIMKWNALVPPPAEAADPTARNNEGYPERDRGTEGHPDLCREREMTQSD